MRRCFVLAVLVAVLLNCVARATADAQSVASPSVTTMREGNDFATRVLGDPWDMATFSDVSTALNDAGRMPYVANWSFNNGIFSAQSTSLNFAQFYVLYPGWIFAMNNAKVGANFPIPSSTYHCLFTRMKVDSTATDSWYISWSNVGETIKGQAYGMSLNNDGLPVGSWRIYKVDLNSPPNGLFYTSWSSQPYWQGLRVDPTNTPNAWFYVDWVRLTDCAPVNYGISWTPVAGQTQLWAGIGGQQKDIYIGNIGGSTASYTWDVQGLEPGTYNIGVQTSSGSMVWLANQLKILPTPIVHFARPSPTSGEDFATAAGDVWDFTQGHGVKSASCVAQTFASQLVMDTPYPSALSPSCKGSIGEADPEIFLSTPAALSGSSYRYLSFYHYINGSQQEPADGMIVRWIWYMGAGCAQVSQGIPLDVGWQEYTVDLFDATQGMPEQSSGCGLVDWRNSTGITQLRFDPNENWTGNAVPVLNFHQEVSWIRLTKEDEVKRGVIFPVQFSLNVPQNQVRSTVFYYTTTPSDPTQNVATAYVVPPIPASLTRKLFLPAFGARPATGAAEAGWTWDTSKVAPGKYYICAAVSDGYNAANYCSEAPVNVLP